MSCDACPRVVNGWFRGCLTATATLSALPITGVILSLPYRGFQENFGVLILFVLCLLPLTLILTCLLSGMPAALVILLGEALRIRSVLFYAPTGATIGALIARSIFGTNLPWNALLVVAGCLAGIAYWFAAGQYAGDDR